MKDVDKSWLQKAAAISGQLWEALVSAQTSAPLWRKPASLAGITFIVVAGALGIAANIQYRYYAALIQAKLGGRTMRTASSIYAAPQSVFVGQSLQPDEVISHLQAAGYTTAHDNEVGWFKSSGSALEIHTGPRSYFAPHAASLRFDGNRLASIDVSGRRRSNEYLLEPELVTSVFDEGRGKRRPVSFSDLPKHLIDALIAVEDKRFFQHGGLDYLRLAKAAYIDLKERRKEQGASTITMQLARSFFLDGEKTYSRKLAEVMLTAELERRFSKQRILELYANEVYLGRRGSFGIHGFGEASRAYLGKDIREIDLADAATLVGMIQRPGYFNPFRNPERVRDRRNLALALMRNNGFITESQRQEAAASPLQLAAAGAEASTAPYFMDLVGEELRERFPRWDFGSEAYRVYTSLDLDLQRLAVDSVTKSLIEVDKALRSRRRNKPGPDPQVALVAMDPHTGAILALVGGRSYSESQLNRTRALRQPGSSFKPFVFAAGLNNSAKGRPKFVTPGTRFEDEPSSFKYKDEVYEPTNYHGAYHGSVTMRLALAKSMNIPTIKAGEMIGFGTVANLARAAGIKSTLYGTPSLALGSYEVTPLEMAEAYTIFSNGGKHADGTALALIKNRDGGTVFSKEEKTEQVLDPRVAYMMTDMMAEVLNSGTGAGVRSRGFAHPAAGKTGTSRDGWFVGYTDTLLCAVWVGYDNNAELELDGAKTALPVWTEFMKRAHQQRRYSRPKPFAGPSEGITTAEIDPTTGMIANAYCPKVRTELFLSGTEPQEVCIDHDENTPFEEINEETGEKRKRPNVLGRVLDVFR